MLEHLRGHDPVELAVRERQRQRVALLDVGLRAVGHLARVAHRAEQVEDPGELVAVLVERDHVPAAPVHLERVPPGAAAHVEDAVPGAQLQPVEVNGQHVLSPRRTSIACW